MATGWTQDGGVNDQIDDTIADAVKRARAKLPAGTPSTAVAAKTASFGNPP